MNENKNTDVNILKLYNRKTRSQNSTDFKQEQNQLNIICNQIMKSVTISSDSNSFSLDIIPLRNLVDHLASIQENVLQFNIDNMISLKMHEFLIENIQRIFYEQYIIDPEIFINILHLILIWSNGNNQQKRYIFNQEFTECILKIVQKYFYSNSLIVNYALNSLKNSILDNFYPNDAVSHLTREIIFLLEEYISNYFSYGINSTILQSVGHVFYYFQSVIRSYVKKDINSISSDELNGIIILTKKWIKFIQKHFFGNSYKDEEEDISFEDKIDEQIKEEVICESLVPSLLCMNDIVKIISGTANLFFKKKFIKNNLFCYLRSLNPSLIINGLRTLKIFLTTPNDAGDFAVWRLIDKSMWDIVKDIPFRLDDSNVKIYYSHVVSSILSKLSVMAPPLNPPISSGPIPDDSDDDDYDIDAKQFEYQKGYLESQMYSHVIDLYDNGILSSVLSLADSEDEPISVKNCATLSIAKNFAIFGYTEVCYFINAGVIPVFVRALELVEGSEMDVVLDAISVIIEYIGKLSRNEKKQFFGYFVDCDAQSVLAEVRDDKAYCGDIAQKAEMIMKSLDELDESLSDKKVGETKSDFLKKQEKKEADFECDKEIFDEYEEEDENVDEDGNS